MMNPYYPHLADVDVPADSMRRNQLLGRKGCIISNGSMVQSPGEVNDLTFTPKSPTFLLSDETKRRVNALTSGLDAKWQNIQQVGNDAINDFNSAGVGGNWSGLGAGSSRVNQLGSMITDLYADANELIVYAPSWQDASKICGQKVEVQARFESLIGKVGVASAAGFDRYAQELEARNKMANDMVELLQLLLDAVRKLVEIIMQIFGGFLSFITRNPTAMKIGLALVGITVAAVVFRPYMSVFSKLIPGRR